MIWFLTQILKDFYFEISFFKEKLFLLVPNDNLLCIFAFPNYIVLDWLKIVSMLFLYLERDEVIFPNSELLSIWGV